MRNSKHSRKLENYCTARMTATEYYIDGMVEVKYYSYHTNHQLGVGECRNLPLPNSVKEDIQQQFVAGITIEQIMDSKFIIVHLILVTRTRVVYVICTPKSRGPWGLRDEGAHIRQTTSARITTVMYQCIVTTNV